MTADELIDLMGSKQLAKAIDAVKANPALASARSDRWYGTTPFHHACCYLNRAAALAFIEAGADLDGAAPCSTEKALTPLEYVCSVASNDTQAKAEDRLAVARALLDAGAKLSPHLVHSACGPRSQALVTLLLERGAPLEGVGLLVSAVECDHPELVSALLARGVDVNEEGSAWPQGSTALHVAVKQRAVGYIERLVKAGARADLKNAKGETPRDLAPKKLLPLLEGGAAPAAAPVKKTTLPRDVLTAVWEAPDDPKRLQVLADAFIEHGQEARGEYVQLSLLEKRTAAQEKRRAQLLAKHRGAWLGEARPLVKAWVDSETEPGFVAHVTVAPDKFLAGFELISALGPRLVVEWTKVGTRLQLKALAKLPLGTLHGLDLRNPEAYGNDTWVDDVALELLAPSLRGLKALALTRLNDRFTSKLFTSLARGAGATLQTLRVHARELDDGWEGNTEKVETLTPQAFPALRELQVSGAGRAVKKVLKQRWGKAVRFDQRLSK